MKKYKMLKPILTVLFLVLFCIPSRGQPSYAKIPITIVDNRAFLEVVIQRDTLQFGIDCGAVNVIDKATADKLKLPKGSEFEQRGAGANTTTAYRTSVNSLKISNSLTFTEQSFIALSLRGIKKHLDLPYLDGILGYNLFRDSVIQIDFRNKYFRFLPEYNQGKHPVEFELYRNQIPMVEVTFMGHSGRFIIDTGDRSSLTINKNFARKTGVFENFQMSDTTITGYGIGRPIYAQTFTLPDFTFSGISFQNVTARVPTAGGGVYSRDDIDGSIGSGLLLGSKLTIDYKRNRIYMEKMPKQE